MITCAEAVKQLWEYLDGLVEETDRREAAVQGMNAHIAFLNEARPLLTRATAQTTNALTTFRIP